MGAETLNPPPFRWGYMMLIVKADDAEGSHSAKLPLRELDYGDDSCRGGARRFPSEFRSSLFGDLDGPQGKCSSERWEDRYA